MIPRPIRERADADWWVLAGYRGSIAHGTYLPSDDPASVDDKDVMAFCVPPEPYYLGMKDYGSRGTREVMKGEWDLVVYELRKALRLLLGGNPNVLSMLWLSENLYIEVTEAGRMLLDNRDAFVGRHAYKAFSGYAYSQLTKMERGAFKGYMGEKRRALVEQHGYDTKNAAHLIRLLRQGIEFLRDGELQVQRPDAAQLIAIRRGEWTIERVKREADILFKRAEDACDRSTLPAKPDAARVHELCVEMVKVSMSDSPRPLGERLGA